MERDELARKLVEVAYLEGDFVLASGRRSRYYFDKYLFETRPELLEPVAELLAARIPAGTQRIAGPELGAVALAAAASIKSGLPSLFIRGAAKAYGTAKRIEGPYEPGESVVVFEDVVTSGGSAIEAAKVMTEAGCKVSKIVAVIDREEGGVEAARAEGFELEGLFTKTELERWLAPGK